jgi:DNA-binding NarL/FixJ family response regulator
MRVIIVGTPRERHALREALDITADVVAEFDTLAGARDAEIAADAILLPTTSREPDSDEILAEALTPREIEVLELVAEGLSNKSIADRLGISDHTVKFHISSLSGKLGAGNRTDAVRRGVQRGLITL